MSSNHRPNILLIMTDEHDALTTGCYGHPIVETPHLDSLAREGVVYDSAYCNSPLCVPSRLSFLTGRYAHQIDAWDNGSSLRSEIPTLGHYLQDAGYETVLCGRTHLLGPDRLHGFEMRLIDDMPAWQSYDQMPLRRPDQRRRKGDSHVTECGPGDHVYQVYDRAVLEASLQYLSGAAGRKNARPWLLYVGFMLPHFPLIAPPDLFGRYYPDGVQLPLPAPPIALQHPAIQQLRRHHCNEKEYPEEQVRRTLASYYALIGLVDRHIGVLRDFLRTSDLLTNTVLLYTSDHGEMAGRHGLWQKMCFYEPSVRVPLLISGGPWSGGERISDDVSLIDILPTLIELSGRVPPAELPGRSLLPPTCTRELRRAVFSEYHGQGIEHAAYMIKKGRYKYFHYVGYQPQLFDLSIDPEETNDLAAEEALADIRSELHRELLSRIDPENVDLQARTNQKRFGRQRIA